MSLREFDSNSGAAIAPDSAPSTARIVTFDRIALDLILTSQTNPRTTFDAVKLQELADSIAGLDVMQPILVRPLPADRLADTALATDASQLLLNDWAHKPRKLPRPAYEIVSGERRYRASILAGKRDIPAMIKSMTDQEVLESQLVENLQRDDLHPMEEAEGYRRLCDTTGINKEDVGAKIGKSRSYVYQRLHLLALGQEARVAFRAGKLDASKAVLLASVGDPKLQLKALKEVTTEGYSGQTMTVRAFRDWLQQNVMLKLDHAPFDIKDATLNEAAGACGTCPKRTGVDRDIFAAFDSPDMCTDGKCFNDKASISLQRIKDAAAAKGMTVIAGKEAKKAKPYSYGDRIDGYTRLDEKVDGGGTLAKVLGKDGPTPMLFIDPHTQKQIKVLPDDVVGQLLKDKGLVNEGPKDQGKKNAAAEARAAAKHFYEIGWRGRAVDSLCTALRGGAVAGFTAPMLRLLLRKLVRDNRGYGTNQDLMRLWGLPEIDGDGYSVNEEREKAVLRHVGAAPDEALGPMVLQALMLDEMQPADRYDVDDDADVYATPVIDQLAAEAGVDLTAIQREVKAEQKAKADEEKAAAKAAAAPSPGTKVKAAPQGSVARKGRKRLSEEQAKSGIAEAMQGVDEPGKGEED